MKLETVKVKATNTAGYAVINLSDLTDDHELYDSGGKKPKRQAKKSVKNQNEPSS